MKICIRKPVKADWPKLIKIADECFGKGEGVSFEETIRGNPWGNVWLMEDGEGEILSFFAIVAEEIAYNWYAVSWVSTPEKHRGNGYATGLLQNRFANLGETIDENRLDYDITIQLVCKDNLLNLYRRTGLNAIFRTRDGYNLMLKEFIYEPTK